MARIYGSKKMVGTVGGIRHYRLPGCDFIVAAEKGGPTKEQVKNSPSYARTRENNAEWAGVTHMAQQVKVKFGQCTLAIVNRFLIGVLNKAMKIVMLRNETDLRGCRSIFLSLHKEVLDTIIYYYYKPFRDIMKCRFEVETATDRKSVTVNLSNFNPREQVKAPKEATHFQFCMCIGVVSDYVYEERNDYFKPVYDNIRLQNSTVEFEGEWIPVNARSMGDLTYTVKIPDGFVLEDDMTVLRIFGITFGKMTSEIELLKKDRGSVEYLGAV